MSSGPLVRSRSAWLLRAVLQVCLAATIAATGATSHRGWAAAAAVLVGAASTALFLRRRPFVVTLADHVTHLRVLLLAAVAGLLVGDASPGLTLTLVVVAVLLDAVDGQVARRRGEASAAGGAFDMAVDCALTALLSVAAVPLVGWWALVIGALPYAFRLAQRLRPALRAPLPPRISRQVIGSVPPFVLGALGLLPPQVARVATALALALLLYSFGRDTIALLRAGDEPPSPRWRVRRGPR